MPGSWKHGSRIALRLAAPVLGIFNSTRGVANTFFNFGVTQPGVDPFRLIWYEQGGGAAAEWFTMTKDGVNVLINSDHPEAIKAFRARAAEPMLPQEF